MTKNSFSNIKYAVLIGTFACFAGLVYSAASLNLKPTDKSQVIAVCPSGEAVRENLLRISVRFDSPVNQAKPPKVALLNEAGEQIEGAFDGQTMWSADGTILTLLLGPGRVKTGLAANEKFGRVLTRSEIVSLVVDGETVKSWRVIEESNEKINLQSWTIETPPPESRDPVEIEFDEPIDAMDAGFIAILAPNGEQINGQATLDAGETKWRFVPKNFWIYGDYQIVVNPHLEDACGNSAASEFEFLSEKLQEQLSIIRLNFKVE